VLEIITMFSARFNGSRSRKHRKLLEDLQASTDVIAEGLGIYTASRPQN
jgi:putative resolvase